MKQGIWAFVMAAVWCAGGWAQAPDLENMDLVERSVPDGPVAKVNGVNIDKDDFMRFYKTQLLSAMAHMGTTQVTDRVRLDTGIRSLGLLIQHELLFQEATRRKLTVSDDDVKKQWAATVEQMQKRIPHQKDRQVTEDDIFRLAGTTREQVLTDLRRGLMVRAMREQIAQERKVAVTEDEIAKVFNENKDAFKQPATIHLQQIYLSTRAGKTPMNDAQKAEARARADNALKRLQAGESFEAVAKAVSEAPDKDKGGDMGPIPEPGLPPFFIERAAKMKPGDISEVIESELGFHIIKLIETVPGSEAELAKAEPKIREMLLEQKADDAADDFCKEYGSKHPESIEIYLELEKTLSTYPGGEELKKKRPAAETKNAETAKPRKSKPIRGKRPISRAPLQ